MNRRAERNRAFGRGVVFGVVLCAWLAATACQLPSPDAPAPPARTGRTLSESQPSWPAPPKPPDRAPNVVIVLADDLGYSDIGAFGSEVETPHLDALAARGIRLSNYTTHPVCSPARAALLTGMNGHSVGMGFVANVDSGFPGYRGEVDPDAATLAEILRARGYATAAVGKWHLTQHMTPAGPYAGWPLGRGFDRFFGILHGEASQWAPHRLYEDNALVRVDTYADDFFLMDALAVFAERWLEEHVAAAPEQPFLLYFPTTAVHSPIHSKAEDRARYAEVYRAGWDRIREQRFQRQRASGLIPDSAVLPPSAPGIPTWDDLTPEAQALYAAHMANYAAMIDNLDQNVGRLVATLERLGRLENTIFLFTSDNGASAAGGAHGWHNWSRVASGLPPISFEHEFEQREHLGDARSYPIAPAGWAQVSNTPFPDFKMSVRGGGRRVPMILSWPARLSDRGLRHQYAHVTDVLPTLLELIGVAAPTRLDARSLREIEGVSFAGLLRDPEAPSLHHEQYYEFGGNRGLLQGPWLALAAHAPGTPFDDREWSLYDLAQDWTETTAIGDAQPERLEAMRNAFDEAARRYQVYPLDDRIFARMAMHSRPTGQTLEMRPHTPTAHANRVSPLIAARSHAIEVRLEQRRGDEGVLYAHGGQVAGSVLFIEKGQLHYRFNGYGEFSSAPATPIAPGHHQIRLENAVRRKQGPLFEQETTLLVDGEARWTRTFSPAITGYPIEGFDVGADRRSPVSWPVFEAHGAFPYTGSIDLVRLEPHAARSSQSNPEEHTE